MSLRHLSSIIWSICLILVGGFISSCTQQNQVTPIGSTETPKPTATSLVPLSVLESPTLDLDTLPSELIFFVGGGGGPPLCDNQPEIINGPIIHVNEAVMRGDKQVNPFRGRFFDVCLLGFPRNEAGIAELYSPSGKIYRHHFVISPCDGPGDCYMLPLFFPPSFPDGEWQLVVQSNSGVYKKILTITKPASPQLETLPNIKTTPFAADEMYNMWDSLSCGQIVSYQYPADSQLQIHGVNFLPRQSFPLGIYQKDEEEGRIIARFAVTTDLNGEFLITIPTEIFDSPQTYWMAVKADQDYGYYRWVDPSKRFNVVLGCLKIVAAKVPEQSISSDFGSIAFCAETEFDQQKQRCLVSRSEFTEPATNIFASWLPSHELNGKMLRKEWGANGAEGDPLIAELEDNRSFTQLPNDQIVPGYHKLTIYSGNELVQEGWFQLISPEQSSISSLPSHEPPSPAETSVPCLYNKLISGLTLYLHTQRSEPCIGLGPGDSVEAEDLGEFAQAIAYMISDASAEICFKAAGCVLLEPFTDQQLEPNDAIISIRVFDSSFPAAIATPITEVKQNVPDLPSTISTPVGIPGVSILTPGVYRVDGVNCQVDSVARLKPLTLKESPDGEYCLVFEEGQYDGTVLGAWQGNETLYMWYGLAGGSFAIDDNDPSQECFEWWFGDSGEYIEHMMHINTLWVFNDKEAAAVNCYRPGFSS